MDTVIIGTVAKNILALKMKTWVDRAITRYCEIHDKIDINEMFAGDKLKHHIFLTAVLPQVSKEKLPYTAVKSEAEYIKGSISYKIGRMITFLPRKLRVWVKRG
jgi:hypothetical protein